MSKITVSTVKEEALVEVIRLNSSFVAKAVRAADIAETINRIRQEDAPQTEALDEHGAPYSNDNEKPVMETDWDAWRDRGYYGLPVKEMFEKLLPFVIELRYALIGE